MTCRPAPWIKTNLAVACGMLLVGACRPSTNNTKPSSTDPVPIEIPGDGMIGCPHGETCTLVLVSESLDDRVDIFSPDDPRGALYRGSIDIDLKPGTEIATNALDEPFGLTLGGGFLHVLLGHFPQRTRGSLVSFPYGFFADKTVGSSINVGDYFSTGATTDDVLLTELGELEPIFVLPEVVQDRLLVTAFANDLFTDEGSWTMAGRLLVIDAADPGRFGVRLLTNLAGGTCRGAAQLVRVTDDTLAIACDGNEAVAMVDLSEVGEGTPAEAAAAINGQLCDLIPFERRRVRYLAPSNDGVLVAEGPTPLTLLSDATLHHLGRDCTVRGTPVRLGTQGQSQPGAVISMNHGDAPIFIVASGRGPLMNGKRGLYIAQDRGGPSLETCGPIPGLDSYWITAGADIEPYALTSVGDGRHLIVGASATNPANEQAIYGRVLWVTLNDGDPCVTGARAVDLTGATPVDPENPRTYRRAPHAIAVHTIVG